MRSGRTPVPLDRAGFARANPIRQTASRQPLQNPIDLAPLSKVRTTRGNFQHAPDRLGNEIALLHKPHLLSLALPTCVAWEWRSAGACGQTTPSCPAAAKGPPGASAVL